MIWTAITYSTANEKIECQVFEGPMDFQNAYGTIASTTNGIVLSLIKGNHQEAAYIPQIDLKLTRAKYRGEF
jgi:hypothetical protein|tara:strand:+ start:276 stop:491 length:216 start_codon:yes stop_codon:yes gene_type:complete